MRPRIAIIGAGLSGLVLAREMAAAAEITVYEKARGVGGRMATRYADPYYFDHGAQCFTARTQAFQDFLQPYLQNGTIAEWQGRVVNFEPGGTISPRPWRETHLVAAPNMNSLCKALAENVPVQLNTEIAPLETKQPDGWHLRDKDGAALGIYDWVISTAPPEQTRRLFEGHLATDNVLNRIVMYGCYALMIGFIRPWDHDWMAGRVHDNPLKWISVNSTKSGRNRDVTCLVAHTRNNWAQAHIDDDVAAMQAFLLAQFQKVTGIDCTTADFLTTHRWRYAIVETTEKSGPFLDPGLGLAATSDWCLTSRLEEVWIAAMELADKLRTDCIGKQ